MANTNTNHRSIIILDSDDCILDGFQIIHKCYEDSDDDDDDDYTYEDYDIEDEDEEIKEEMTPPKVVTSEDGLKGVLVVFKHDWSTLGKRKTPSVFDDHDCPLCDKPFTTGGGDHRVCSLPCGHMYGMSCINSLLQPSQGSGKCPRCNTLCALKDVRLLYPARTDSTILKASTKHFPFTKEGLRDFKHYALKRRADALKLRTATLERKTVVVDCMVDALKRKMNEELRRRPRWQQGRASESTDKELEHQVDTLQQSVYALDREVDAFGCRADALKRRADILKWRAKACKASMYFFEQRYNEHMEWVRENTKIDWNNIMLQQLLVTNTFQHYYFTTLTLPVCW